MNFVVFCWEFDQHHAERVGKQLKLFCPESRIIYIKQKDVSIEFEEEQYVSKLSGFGCNHDRIHEFRDLFESLDHFVKVDPDCKLLNSKIFDEIKSRTENIRGIFVGKFFSSCFCYFDRYAIGKILTIPPARGKKSEDHHWTEFLLNQCSRYPLVSRSVIHPFPSSRKKKRIPYKPLDTH